MPDILEVSLQQIGTGSCGNGKTMGIEVRDEHGGAVRLFTEAANVPSLVGLLLLGAKDVLAQMDPNELLGMVSRGETVNLMDPIQATQAKAFIEGATGRLMLHLGPIAVQFQLPTQELRALAQGIGEQA